jgi:hypothetical protein
MQHSQQCFTPGMITPGYPEMKCKAWNSRVISAWLHHECCAFFDDSSPEHILYKTVTYHLAMAYNIMEDNPRVLGPVAADELHDHGKALIRAWFPYTISFPFACVCKAGMCHEKMPGHDGIL